MEDLKLEKVKKDHVVLELLPLPHLEYRVFDYLIECCDNMPLITPEYLYATVITHLPTSVVSFAFLKEDGDIEQTYGTLKPELLPNRLGELATEALNELIKQVDAIATDLTASRRIVESAKAYDQAPEAKEEPGYVSYYDLKEFQWRRFHKDKVVAIL
jgi:hypothetical protein